MPILISRSEDGSDLNYLEAALPRLHRLLDGRQYASSAGLPSLSDPPSSSDRLLSLLPVLASI